MCPEGRLWVDVEAFEEAARTARRSREPAAYRAAIELYSGELLPEERYEEWAESRRQELRRTLLSLLVELAELYQERGGKEELESAVEALRRALTEEPSNEEAHVGLMRLYALSGKRAEALAQYERLEEVLSRKLGAEPSATSRHLYEEITTGTFLPAQRPPAALPPGKAADASNHNLPAPRTSFVGRQREILEMKRSLEAVMNSIRNGLGMRKAGDRGGAGQPEIPLSKAVFTQVHNTL